MHRESQRAHAIAAFRRHLLGSTALLEALPTLEGKRLGCWCKPRACHGDVWVEAVSARPPVPLSQPPASEDFCHCATFVPWPAEDLQGDGDSNQDLIGLCHTCERPRVPPPRSEWQTPSTTSQQAFAQGLAGARKVARCRPEPPAATLVTPMGYVALTGEAIGPDGALHLLRARPDQAVTLVFY